MCRCADMQMDKGIPHLHIRTFAYLHIIRLRLSQSV